MSGDWTWAHRLLLTILGPLPSSMTKEVVIMGPNPGDVQPGMAVVSLDGRYIGMTKSIQEPEDSLLSPVACPYPDHF